MNDRAIVYRRKYNIPSEWGTAVNVQAMVFGNTGESSGSGKYFAMSDAFTAAAAAQTAERTRIRALHQNHADKRDDDQKMNNNQNLLHGGLSKWNFNFMPRL